jgi:uncharacterized protein (TIGR00661 family)
LRKSVLQLTLTDKDHLLVYLTSGFDSLIDVLKFYSRERFVVYGYKKEETDGNIQFREFSKEGFLQDLASCKGIIATAGFTLISEALYLGKPYLAFPMEGQFEQQLNAHMLQQQGYGAKCTKPNQKELSAFFIIFLTLKRPWPNIQKAAIVQY